MEFVLFILVIATLLVRPTDFVPGLESVPLYLIVICLCVAASFPRLAAVVVPGELGKVPVGVFMLGILGVSVVSNFAQGHLDGGLDFATEYGKLIIFFFLLVGIVDTPARLRAMLKVVVVVALIPVSLAILNYDGWIEVPGYKVTVEFGRANPDSGEQELVRRLGASGSFADPNDVTEIVNVSLIFGLSALLDRRSGPRRFVWLLPVPIFFYALYSTQSRGGLLGLMAGLSVLALVKLGGRRAVILGGLGIPLLLAVAGGRQATISTSDGTGQARIQLWDAAFDQLIRSPLLGVGTGRLVESLGHVAHNAFIQAAAELGLFGGMFIFGIYYYLATTLVRARRERPDGRDSDLTALRPYILAGLASFTMNEMSLTHPFYLFTYVVTGLGSAWVRIADQEAPIEGAHASWKLFGAVCGWAFVFFVLLFAFTKYSVRY